MDSEIIAAIRKLDDRLQAIEKKLGMEEVPPEVPKMPKPEVQKPARSEAKPGNLLGIVGVCCLIVAMILLIKFSIDSGWLTPARQLFLSAIFGGSLIALPFFINSKDKAYVSLLPAGGVVILHLTVYGGVYVHQLLHPFMATVMVWGIGFLSLWLLTKFKEDVYALLAIAGTYVGSYLVKDSFNNLPSVAVHLLIWDFIFVSYGITLKRRLLISTTAYFALGLVAFFGLSYASSMNSDLALQLAIIQFLQILIIVTGTAAYSIHNKETLGEKEIVQLFPVFLFFYGLEFYYLSMISPNLAIAFSLTFSALILGVYFFAKNRLKDNALHSSQGVYALASIMFFHSVYFVALDDIAKVVFGLILMLIIGLKFEKFKSVALKPVLFMSGFVVLYSMVLVMGGRDFHPAQGIGFSFIYGAFLFTGYKKSAKNGFIVAANIMLVIGITRLGEVIGEIWVGPLCVTYSFLTLLFALKTFDKVLAKATLPVVFFAIGRFVVFNFGSLSQGERIISLILMGAIIYASGFVYRKIPDLKTNSTP